MDEVSNIVIIPTFKERENIEAIVKSISSLAIAFDILIIDDNSPDGTADIVKDLQKSLRNLHLIERPGKMGLGTAYIAGFKWALEKNYNYNFFQEPI
jgi:dolichol-phosphate mannosyltransferase